MPPFQKLAKHMVVEMPVAKLQAILKLQPGLVQSSSGGFCGKGCPGVEGKACGLDCRPKASATDVIDREGRLGLTAKDLTAIRKDLPKLRQAVARQVEVHLGRLR